MHSLNTIQEQNKSNAKKLIDLTIKNGGASFNNDLKSLTFKQGFAVGTKEVLQGNNFEELERILNKLEPYKATFTDASQGNVITNGFYGLWIDAKGIFYLDKSINILDYQTAVNYGKKFEQISIYDFKNEIEINLEGGK
tara:strand:- start:49 stop:465 length:417 start_codon:yes stop_codon:yes gene_type:complete